MIYRIQSKILIAVLLAVSLLAGGISGCGKTDVVVPPPPPPATTVTVAPETTAAASPTTSATTAPVETKAIIISSNEVAINFPDDVVFSVAAESQAAIKSITLKYGSDERTLVPEIASSKAVFTEDKKVSTSWTWLLKKTGSIPPGATLWWKWEITNANGEKITTEKKTAVCSDTRFEWVSREYPDYILFWHDQDETLINELISAVKTGISRIELDVQIPNERKPKVFIYASSAELRDAVLFEQQWTGALAYYTYNIILTAVSDNNLDWAKDALPHELTHLLVGEATFGPFGDRPTWLDEGLAQYSESAMSAAEKQLLDEAKNSGTLLALGSLSGSFPTSSEGAYLAYAESRSIVEYLITEYGWEKMRFLLETFKGGETDDKALMEVYSFGVSGLETLWKSYLNTN